MKILGTMRSSHKRARSWWTTLLALPLLAACSAQPGPDIAKNYLTTVRDLQLSPIYPPREEFQVGDVYFIENDPKDINDITSTRRFWLGAIENVLKLSNDYLSSRINYVDSDLNKKKDAFEIKPPQNDLRTGIVSLADGERRSLPLVSFPSVSGRASTAGAFGGYGFVRSFGLAFGQNESVDLDFGDTRAFGLPPGALAIDESYQPAFRRHICPVMQSEIVQRLDKDKNPVLENGHPVFDYECSEGKDCQVLIVTRTILTRSIDFTYSNAQIARLALNRLTSEPPDTPTALPLPGNLNLDITIGPDSSGEGLDKLVTGLTTAIDSAQGNGANANETSALSFAGINGRGLTFRRTFRKPVAIAWEGYEVFPEDAAQLCRVSARH